MDDPVLLDPTGELVPVRRAAAPGPVLVATTEFTDAVSAQAEALASTPRYALVVHPIQNRADDELRVLPERAVEPILDQLLAGG